MSAALKQELSGLTYRPAMTAAAFADWPGDGFHWRHALIEGEPVAMSPPSPQHGLIGSRLDRLIGNHLVASRPHCAIAGGIGVRPRAGAATNVRVPDFTVVCGPQTGRYARDPVLIAEILSPSNEDETREAVRACLTIPSLAEVLILDSLDIRAEVLTRQPDGTWPENPAVLGAEAELVLASIDFRCPLRELYPA